jgi:hypothetical protein
MLPMFPVAHKHAISADTALRLGHYFGVNPQFWLNLQSTDNLRRCAGTAGPDRARHSAANGVVGDYVPNSWQTRNQRPNSMSEIDIDATPCPLHCITSGYAEQRLIEVLL